MYLRNDNEGWLSKMKNSSDREYVQYQIDELWEEAGQRENEVWQATYQNRP
jgi:hypothetical protein